MMDQMHDWQKVPGIDRVIHVAGFEPRKRHGLSRGHCMTCPRARPRSEAEAAP